MSQDNERCPKCGAPSGYDDHKAYWGENNLYLCRQCKNNLIARFATFFGLQGISSDNSGIIIEFKDADAILQHIIRDEAMRICYIVADKERYEGTIQVSTSVLEDSKYGDLVKGG